MIYFDNAATGGKKPLAAVLAAYAAIKDGSVNPGRSGHRLSVNAAFNVLACRKLLCGFLGGYCADRVVFTKNCTEALNIVLFGGIPAGARVVTTAAEHNSVLRPLHKLQKEGKIELEIVRPAEGESFENALGKSGKDADFLVFTLASNVTGMPIDAKAVRRLAGEKPYIVCDGAQACGHIGVNMKESGIDALALAGHKGMHGIQGSGALLFSPRLKIEPVQFGGTGSESYNLDMPDVYPDALEAGTLNYPAILSLFEGTLYVQSKLTQNAHYVSDLTALAIERLKTVAGVKIYSKKNASGIVAFEHANVPSEMLAQMLSDEYGIAVRGGLHCAPLMHEYLKTEQGLVRASLSEFNTPNEVLTLFSAVRDIAHKYA